MIAQLVSEPATWTHKDAYESKPPPMSADDARIALLRHFHAGFGLFEQVLVLSDGMGVPAIRTCKILFKNGSKNLWFEAVTWEEATADAISSIGVETFDPCS